MGKERRVNGPPLATALASGDPRRPVEKERGKREEDPQPRS